MYDQDNLVAESTDVEGDGLSLFYNADGTLIPSTQADFCTNITTRESDYASYCI